MHISWGEELVFLADTCLDIAGIQWRMDFHISQLSSI